MVKRNRKKYEKPKKPFDKVRIDEENELRKKYGLKNKREIWKADASIRRIRNLAKELITKSDEEKKLFVEKLQKRGFQVENLADALALNKEDWLKRRLQTVVFLKGLATTPKQARQLVAHKHVSVGNQLVNIPSYMVELEEEPDIKLNIALKLMQKKARIEEIQEELEKEKEIAEDIAEEVEKEDKRLGRAEEKTVKEEVKKVKKGRESIEEAEKEIAEDIAEEIEKEDKKLEKAEEEIVKNA